ncbi:AI-2E family transporter [Mariluticola halotolerans]|uniref:AI-2E family transporter n=1 Tax=Mariluticola halotolerans TaxID=2909283 RepID=UPI0026E1C4CD|nr:AI-2E family transporter [Mariluticola halotolerans]UJQ94101.1 AI-2E family transporter [Mariluticola halotolerans]
MARGVSNRVVARPTADQLEATLRNSARLAVIGVSLLIFIFAAQQAQSLLAPLSMALVIGLMFGPVADRIEGMGIPPALSALAVLVLFIVLIAVIFFGMAIPLSEWVSRLPQIWAKLQAELYKWRGVLSAVQSVQEAVQGLGGNEAKMLVAVEDGSAVQSAAFLAPAVLAQVGLFLVSMYFFIATRRQIQRAALSFAFTRKFRLRLLRLFSRVEMVVSRYLLSITFINLGMGAVVGLAMWSLGMPSPLLWGALAFLFNYVVFIGMAALSVILFVVALGTMDTPNAALVPVLVYLAINFIEAQFVTPNVLGRMMTLNPLVVFISVTFWIWLWGPVGGFVAVPFLLMAVEGMRQFGLLQLPDDAG